MFIDLKELSRDVKKLCVKSKIFKYNGLKICIGANYVGTVSMSDYERLITFEKLFEKEYKSKYGSLCSKLWEISEAVGWGYISLNTDWVKYDGGFGNIPIVVQGNNIICNGNRCIHDAKQFISMLYKIFKAVCKMINVVDIDGCLNNNFRVTTKCGVLKVSILFDDVQTMQQWVGAYYDLLRCPLESGISWSTYDDMNLQQEILEFLFDYEDVMNSGEIYYKKKEDIFSLTGYVVVS